MPDFYFMIFISYILLHTMTQIAVYLGVYHEILLLLLHFLDGGHRMSLSFVLHFPIVSLTVNLPYFAECIIT